MIMDESNDYCEEKGTVCLFDSGLLLQDSAIKSARADFLLELHCFSHLTRIRSHWVFLCKSNLKTEAYFLRLNHF